MPDGIIPLHFNNSILKADVIEDNILFEKKPIGDPDPHFSRGKYCILVLVLDENTAQVHVIEQ